MKGAVYRVCLLGIGLVLSGLFSGIQAQSDADAVIDAFIEASGGAARLSQIDSFEATARMKMAGMPMDLDVYLISKAPNLVYMMQFMQGLGEIKQGFDGKVGWSADPLQGNRELTPGELKELIAESSPRWVLEIKDRYTVRKVAEETDLSVTLSLQETAIDEPEIWTFSKQSGLLISQSRIVDMGPTGRLPVVFTFDDYRKVEDIVLPFITRAENPAFQFSMQGIEMKLNPEVDLELFKPPF